MTWHVERIIQVLASSDISRSELNALTRWLRQRGPDGIEEAVAQLRWEASQIVQGSGKKVPAKRISKNFPDSRQINKGIGKVSEEIKRLLRVEAKLSATQASDLLLDHLRKKYPDEVVELQKQNKESFVRWVKRISYNVPDYELLHAATAVRNRFVHSQSPDWPLRERKSN